MRNRCLELLKLHMRPICQFDPILIHVNRSENMLLCVVRDVAASRYVRTEK